jgi:hypothetical protein
MLVDNYNNFQTNLHSVVFKCEITELLIAHLIRFRIPPFHQYDLGELKEALYLSKEQLVEIINQNNYEYQREEALKTIQLIYSQAKLAPQDEELLTNNNDSLFLDYLYICSTHVISAHLLDLNPSPLFYQKSHFFCISSIQNDKKALISNMILRYLEKKRVVKQGRLDKFKELYPRHLKSELRTIDDFEWALSYLENSLPKLTLGHSGILDTAAQCLNIPINHEKDKKRAFFIYMSLIPILSSSVHYELFCTKLKSAHSTHKYRKKNIQRKFVNIPLSNSSIEKLKQLKKQFNLSQGELVEQLIEQAFKGNREQ